MPTPINPRKDRPEVPWKPQTYYVIKISLFKGNPYHKAILYTGFLHDGIPLGYAQVYHPTYDAPIEVQDARYNMSVFVISEIKEMSGDDYGEDR